MKQVNVNVHYLTRVEGHGNIVLNAKDGKIEKLKWEVIEAPRLFEAMLRGRHFEDVPIIASRICGICSISHTLASIQSIENAFKVKPSEQTILLRKVLYYAELMESHVLHALFLAAPDFLGVKSVFPLVETHKDVVVMALRLKKLAYNLAEAVAGRKTHPLGCVVGGFAKIPDINEILALKARLEASRHDFDTIIKLFKTLNIPDFVRETEYIALKDTAEYAFIEGDIASSDAGITPLVNYLDVTNEFCVPWSTAKYARNTRESYMVGALSRFNLNYEQLLPSAKAAAKELGLKAPCHNPFMNTVAQVVESVHCVDDCLSIIETLARTGLEDEIPNVRIIAGRGVGAVEAPRGVLFHDYTFDDKGVLQKANCIIPTNQNHNNIQKDMEAMVPGILEQPEDEVRQMLEMLVRAYDPCISCSTHSLKIEIKK
jgi:sulfhydrogenase subunit alpha